MQNRSSQIGLVNEPQIDSHLLKRYSHYGDNRCELGLFKNAKINIFVN
jgi:hypothetical protein